jgi:hypothetical protein
MLLLEVITGLIAIMDEQNILIQKMLGDIRRRAEDESS